VYALRHVARKTHRRVLRTQRFAPDYYQVLRLNQRSLLRDLIPKDTFPVYPHLESLFSNLTPLRIRPIAPNEDPLPDDMENTGPENIPDSGFNLEYFDSLIPDEGILTSDLYNKIGLTPDMFLSHLPTLRQISQSKHGIVTRANLDVFYAACIPVADISLNTFLERAGMKHWH
jgi:hypothetical protein